MRRNTKIREKKVFSFDIRRLWAAAYYRNHLTSCLKFTLLGLKISRSDYKTASQKLITGFHGDWNYFKAGTREICIAHNCREMLRNPKSKDLDLQTLFHKRFQILNQILIRETCFMSLLYPIFLMLRVKKLMLGVHVIEKHMKLSIYTIKVFYAKRET